MINRTQNSIENIIKEKSKAKLTRKIICYYKKKKTKNDN